MVARAVLVRSLHWDNRDMNQINIPTIQERYHQVCDQIEEATVRSGRAPGSVQLVTVTKSQSVEVIRSAIAAGATHLGENYVEEAVAKIDVIKEHTVEWHMIGHIQSRKAELVAEYFDMVHSLDSTKLAGRLEKSCAKVGRIMPALLEVNVSGEESKFGFTAWDEHLWPDLEPELGQILALPHLGIVGLMTMPPFLDDPQHTRPYFQRMRRLQNYLMDHFPQTSWAELSMGTSVDFIAAVEEGATIVRVGSSILGPRQVEGIYDI
jgi:PLP dependent protein